MTKKNETKINCPGCGRSADFMAYDSINVNVNPRLREQVLSDDIFKFKCEHCGHEDTLFYPFLYHDMQNRFWILIVPDKTDDASSAPELPEIAKRSMVNYRSRLVSHVNDFKEKIFIFEAGLDDRVLEMLKLFVRKNILDEEKRLLPEVFLFYGLETDEQNQPSKLRMVCLQEEQEESWILEWSSYTELQKWMYSDLGLVESEPLEWLRVDQDYAITLLKNG